MFIGHILLCLLNYNEAVVIVIERYIMKKIKKTEYMILYFFSSVSMMKLKVRSMFVDWSG